MIECPCCDNETDGPVCELCGIGLPGDWQECHGMYHTVQPRERMPRGYDAYEDLLGEHGPTCGCITCIAGSTRPYGPMEEPSFEQTQKEYHGIVDPDNPSYDN